MSDVGKGLASSRENFQQARRQAVRAHLSARFKGKDDQLLPFDVIRQELRQQNPLYRGVKQVPINQIVGSVGRYHEFNRQFLPLSDSLQDRWAQVDMLAASKGWPPIELYQIGNAYFVRDGNHRVSVASQADIPTIEAHVWQFPSDILIDPDDDLDQVLIQLGERNFMHKTKLDQLYPDHNIHFTTPGGYSELLAQIQNLQAILTEIDGSEMPYDETITSWYEMIYLPTIQIIKESTLLADFAGRTEADLFVWLSRHRDRLKTVYGACDNLSQLAQRLADQYREGSLEKISRKVKGILGQDELPPLEDE